MIYIFYLSTKYILKYSKCIRKRASKHNSYREINTLDNVNLIFYENPIGRGYINTLLELGRTNTKIIYHSSFSFLTIYRKYLFNKNNFFPLLFIKDKKLRSLMKEIETFFSLRKNFLKDMYKYNNIYHFKNIKYVNAKSINSKKLLKYIKSTDDINFLISHQELVKGLLDSKKKFFHYHPGYLPKVRGADGSLHSILNHDELGCTLFQLDKKIDNGPIIRRKIFEFQKFKLSNFKNYNEQELYRIWFSFVDPALRCSLLKECFKEKIRLDKFIDVNASEESNYYTFMDNNEVSVVFKKIFCN